MSEFEGNPIKVVAQRTEVADRNFADWHVSAERQDAIARQLKEVPRSVSDIENGNVRLREVEDGFEVAFVLAATDEKFIVLVIGYDRKGEMEASMSYLKRVAMDALPSPAKTLLEGRKRKDEL
jgi:hypothetical protein